MNKLIDYKHSKWCFKIQKKIDNSCLKDIDGILREIDLEFFCAAKEEGVSLFETKLEAIIDWLENSKFHLAIKYLTRILFRLALIKGFKNKSIDYWKKKCSEWLNQKSEWLNIKSICNTLCFDVYKSLSNEEDETKILALLYFSKVMI